MLWFDLENELKNLYIGFIIILLAFSEILKQGDAKILKIIVFIIFHGIISDGEEISCSNVNIIQ